MPDRYSAEFVLKTEGNDKLTYQENDKPFVVGNFYFSRLAAKFMWGASPQKIRITVEAID